MRMTHFLFASVAIVAVGFDVVDAIKYPEMGNKASVDSVTPTSGLTKRSLRSKTVEEDNRALEDRKDTSEDEEERTTLGNVKGSSLKFLDNLAAHMAAVPGATQRITDENTEIFKKIAAQKWSPDMIAKKLNIETKLETMSKGALQDDPDYLFWSFYKIFWDARKA